MARSSIVSAADTALARIGYHGPEGSNVLGTACAARRVSWEQYTMVHPPPTPEDLARWLFTHAAGTTTTPDGLAGAADQLYGQLRTRLADVFGPTGFDALWARAMYLAHGTLPPGEGDAAPSTEFLPPGVPAGVLDQDPIVAREALITTFASFIALLFTFVGPPLGRGLLGQIWPALLPATLDPQTGERTE